MDSRLGLARKAVPIAASAHKSIRLLPQGKLKVYPNASHALYNINIDEVNADLLDFVSEAKPYTKRSLKRYNSK
ncbi:hypothetical protein C8A00DRAFT_19584 [Chaetomidium leptoderma]|uniref:Uncharacterized protein n=1 Tax=Chaetomidium leptoderma TaxID=669021 RepID=A0AAN6ZSP0_9PEZI|nr:hypothetical protein C8A00DRAFT_19584 [Chaetomidium leptoderma]